ERGNEPAFRTGKSLPNRSICNRQNVSFMQRSRTEQSAVDLWRHADDLPAERQPDLNWRCVCQECMRKSAPVITVGADSIQRSPFSLILCVKFPAIMFDTSPTASHTCSPTSARPIPSILEAINSAELVVQCKETIPQTCPASPTMAVH